MSRVRNRFVQRIPAGVDHRLGQVTFDFDTTEELLSHSLFQTFAEIKGHEKFVMSGNVVLAISNDGYHWWGVGYISFPSKVELPQWEGAKERTTIVEQPEPELLEVVTEQKTFDSTPITDEDRKHHKQMFGEEDITGGLSNIDIPDEAMQKSIDQYTKAKEFIELADNVDSIAHREDVVNVKFTPEEMVILKEILEDFSVNMCGLNYMYDVMDIESKYDQQKIIRQLRDRVDGTLDEYVKIRPYSAFLTGWVKRIGKDKIRTDAKK